MLSSTMMATPKNPPPQQNSSSLLSKEDPLATKDAKSASSVASTAILEEDDEDPELPLWYYQRSSRNGDLAQRCTASILGKVTLNQTTSVWTPAETTSSAASSAPAVRNEDIPQTAWYNQTMHLIISGYSNGQIAVTEATTNAPILLQDGEAWCVSDQPIAALSIDAAGTNFAAVDVQGNCTLWTVKYAVQYRNDESTAASSSSNPPNRSKAPSGNILSKLFGRSGKDAASNSTVASSPLETPDATSTQRIPVLTMVDIKMLRLPTYSPALFGTPTCLCIDPNFTVHNKLLVGFASGKLVLSCRNWMRRWEEPVTLPFIGESVAAMAWRGALLAVADARGVQLYDTAAAWKAIAQVDRPVGAAPALYRWLNHEECRMRPHLCWETRRSLLVAWGDCLMTLAVDTRQVACTMAWALDGIVAADVVPMDRRHVAVLGHVLSEELDVTTNQRIIANAYEMELQILDRTNGSIVYSDLLQLQETELASPEERTHLPDQPSVPSTIHSNFRLLSSFAVPRMDDSLELKEERGGDGVLEILPGDEFVDSHLKWDLSMVSFQESFQMDNDNASNRPNHEEDTESVDSDDYCFMGKTTNTSETSYQKFVPPPVLVIVSDNDTVLARIRDLDDAIQFALDNRKPALALRWALASRVHCFQRYSLNDLVNHCLRSLLRLQSSSTSANIGTPLPVRHLSLRRMTLAAQALPFLLGGNVDLWKLWLSEFEMIPGALFLVCKYIPVRDPKLPKALYSRVLSKMLDEVSDMRQTVQPDASERLMHEAEGHVLNTLLAWGTTQSLQEHIKLFEYQASLDNAYNSLVRRTVDNLNYRMQQSAVGYLDIASAASIDAASTDVSFPINSTACNGNDSLYAIDDLLMEMVRRSSIGKFEFADTADLILKLSTQQLVSSLTIDAIAKLSLMKGNYDEALKCFLVIGSMHSSKTLEEIENDAVRYVNFESSGSDEVVGPYSFVLYLVERYHLYQCLLEANFLPAVLRSSPICALVQLVGLTLVGDFLIKSCTAPQQTSTDTSVTVKSDDERRGTLPLDLVAEQLKGTPKLLHWYLHLIVGKRPEFYVRFPTTANPPPIVAALHKKHLDFYIRYAGPNRDSAHVLAGVEAYLVVEKSTPLLAFLKLILPLGSVSPIEVGKMLEIERRGGAGVSRTFALELAYIMENYGSNSESDALLRLELFLKGAQSLMLAASFAQRAKSHKLLLWERLTEHCLLTSKSDTLSDGSISGVHFGSLLEAAALSGADLAHLVAQIPTGMQVEGLRPRLVAAVADYRLKVQLHAKANEMARSEISMLHQEASRRSHRGIRFDASTDLLNEDTIINASHENANVTTNDMTVMSSMLRPRKRPSRYSFSFTIPIR